MKKPNPRTLPPRNSDNDGRRLHDAPLRDVIDRLVQTAQYHGVPRHKANPRAFGLPSYNKKRGDETLCDRDANFRPDQMANVSALLRRGIRAGLIGKLAVQGVPTIVWTVADDGWIFEARVTNPSQADYHGFPVRGSEAIAERVYVHFAQWVRHNGTQQERLAAENCRALYGFRE